MLPKAPTRSCLAHPPHRRGTQMQSSPGQGLSHFDLPHGRTEHTQSLDQVRDELRKLVDRLRAAPARAVGPCSFSGRPIGGRVAGWSCAVPAPSNHDGDKRARDPPQHVVIVIAGPADRLLRPIRRGCTCASQQKSHRCVHRDLPRQPPHVEAFGLVWTSQEVEGKSIVSEGEVAGSSGRPRVRPGGPRRTAAAWSRRATRAARGGTTRRR